MLQQCHSYATKQSRNPNPVLSALPIPFALKSKSQPHLHVHPIADGFVGSELQLVPTKKPVRKENPARRKARPHPTATGLDLVSGLLPASAVHRT
jgi:hypothetical protein